MKRGSHRKATPQEIERYQYILTPPTETMVYILGFLWADGTIGSPNSGGYITSCEIAHNDFKDLEKIIDTQNIWIKSYRNRPNRKPQACFRSNNKPFHEFLVKNDYHLKKNVTPAKILNFIPDYFRYLWWRGYFDGDGCLYTHSGIHQVSFSAAYDYDWSIMKAFIKEKIDIPNPGIQYVITNRGYKYSALRITNYFDCIKFCDYIYQKNIGIGLERKYNKYLELIKQEPSLEEKYRHENRRRLIAAYNKDTGKLVGKWKSRTECIKDLGIDPSSMYKVLNDKWKHTHGYNLRYVDT
jgi:hypothetical protein